MPRKIIDLTGRRIGKWRVVCRADKLRWKAACDCGTTRKVLYSHLSSGESMSCGCGHDEAVSVANTTHGHTRNGAKSKTYLAWSGMKGRCLNPNNQKYIHYGGRGIRVCDAWLDSFDNFLGDMGEVGRGLSLERVDVNGDYNKANCVWATTETQANNKQNSRKITVDGRTQTIAQWSRETGLYRETIMRRLAKGIDPKKVLEL